MATTLLLDTSIVSIAWDEGNKFYSLVNQKLSVYDPLNTVVAAPTIGEIEYGLLVSPKADSARQASVRANLSNYTVMGIDLETTGYYARLRSELFKTYAPRNKQGRLTRKRPEDLLDKTAGRELGIQENDLWIVSVAIQNDARFITQDGRLQRILSLATRLYGYNLYEVWDLETEYKRLNP